MTGIDERTISQVCVTRQLRPSTPRHRSNTWHHTNLRMRVDSLVFLICVILGLALITHAVDVQVNDTPKVLYRSFSLSRVYIYIRLT